MLSDAQVREFDRNGCLIGGKVISDGDVEESVSYTHLTLPTILRV